MRRVRRPIVRGRKRPVEWITASVSNWNSVAPGATAGYGLISALALSEYTSPTIVRIVGRVYVTPEPYPSLNDQLIYGWGIITTPDITITVSDYDPLGTTGGKRDWMWWKTGAVFYTSNDNQNQQHWDLDIRVNRKVNKEQDLSFYITNSALSTVDLRYNIGARVLVKD